MKVPPMKVYLSIDLDYWQRQHDAQFCTVFFQKVWKLGLPICVALYHHHLLPHINGCDCDTLINVDYHSDLADLDSCRALDFQEGTWGNFVDWRYGGTFIWRYPLPGCVSTRDGYCHTYRNPFEAPEVAHWNRVQKRCGLLGIPWNRVKAVGVSLSPHWIGHPNTLVEPLDRLHINHWLDDHYRQTDRGHAPRRRQPKFMRVKI